MDIDRIEEELRAAELLERQQAERIELEIAERAERELQLAAREKEVVVAVKKEEKEVAVLTNSEQDAIVLKKETEDEIAKKIAEEEAIARKKAEEEASLLVGALARKKREDEVAAAKQSEIDLLILEENSRKKADELTAENVLATQSAELIPNLKTPIATDAQSNLEKDVNSYDLQKQVVREPEIVQGFVSTDIKSNTQNSSKKSKNGRKK